MELRRETFTSELLLPGADTPTTASVEVRWDPLTGHSARLVAGASLLPDTTVDVAEVVARTRTGCPFCPDAIETATPRFPPRLSPEGRIRVGAAVLFPNLLAYSQHSSVAVYGADLHHLPLAELTSELLRANLTAQRTFVRAVQAADPAAGWASVNANHLPPSGSSIYHPHTQGSVHPVPTTMQRLLTEVPAGAYEEFLVTERRLGERYLGRTGRIDWFAAFAPIAPAEIRGYLTGVTSFEELDDDTIAALSAGLAAGLVTYAGLGVTSFNLACYGAPAAMSGYPFQLRLVARSGMAPYYRSDAMYLERLHWEAATGIRPEDLAERARPIFR